MEEKLSNEHRLTAVEDRAKSNTLRLDDLEKKVDNTTSLVTSVAVMAEKLNTMESDMSDVKTAVKKIAEKSGKRWDNIVDKALLGIVAAVVAYMLTHLGL